MLNIDIARTWLKVAAASLSLLHSNNSGDICSGNNSTNHRFCFSKGVADPGEQHACLLIVDCTENIFVRGCAVPLCKLPPKNGKWRGRLQFKKGVRHRRDALGGGCCVLSCLVLPGHDLETYVQHGLLAASPVMIPVYSV